MMAVHRRDLMIETTLDTDDKRTFISSMRTLYPGTTFKIGVDAIVGRRGCRFEHHVEEEGGSR